MPDPNLPCIYCWGRRNDDSRSLEHIWPQALGGAFAPDLFRTDQVCIRCNSLAGQFVDAAFMKNFLLTSETLSAAHRYLDGSRPTAVPLGYQGFVDDFPCEPGEVCERWLGPAGDSIFHVHGADDERWDTFAGGDAIRRKRDPGRVYMSLASEHPYWFGVSVLSFLSRFQGAKHRLATQVEGVPLRPSLLNPFQEPITDVERREVELIRERRSWNPTRTALSIDFSERFLCKMAIGLAYNILGPGVMQTSYVLRLRQAFWTKDSEERRSLGLRGADFWHQVNDERMRNLMSWPGAWVIFVLATPEGLGFMVVMPNGRQIGMLATEGHEGWPPDAGQTYGHGQVYIIVPQREMTVGPLPMIEYSSFKAGIGGSERLKRLQAMAVRLDELPPKR